MADRDVVERTIEWLLPHAGDPEAADLIDELHVVSEALARQAAEPAVEGPFESPCYLPAALDGPPAPMLDEAVVEPTDLQMIDMTHAALKESRRHDPPLLPMCKEIWAAEIIYRTMLAALSHSNAGGSQ